MYSACTVCKCVDIGGKRGVGEIWRSPTKQLLSAQKLLWHSLSLRLLVRAHLLQYPHHHAVRAQAGLQQRGAHLGLSYQTLMDSLMTWRMNSLPGVWGPKYSMRARCMERVRNVAAHCSKTTGSHS